MKERILKYRRRIDEIIADGRTDVIWENVMNEHLTQISFFQHERVVHLIVTITFALLEIISISLFLITEQIPVLVLCGAVMILLVPYVFHYYLLENEVQKMYVQYDYILTQLNKKSDN